MSTTIRDLDPVRSALRDVLTNGHGGAVRVEGDEGKVEVSISPDGVSSWLLKISSGDRVFFDCRGMGVTGLTDEGLCFMILACLRSLRPAAKVLS